MKVMERRRVSKRARGANLVLLYLCLITAATSSFPHSADARKSVHLSRGVVTGGSTSSDLIKRSKKVVVVNHEEEAIVLKRLDITTTNPPIVLPDVVADINEHDHDDDSVSTTNAEPYAVSSPFSLPPFDSLAPIPLPESISTPPFCEYPPSTPTSPSSIPITTNPSPPSPIGQGGGGGGGGGGYTPSVPLFSSTPTSPSYVPIITNPSPPSPIGQGGGGGGGGGGGYTPSPPPPPPSISNVPSPSGYIPNPPIYFNPPSPTTTQPPFLSPPPSSNYEPSPPSYVVPIIGPPPPSAYGFVPTPPVFQPPVVYPPPTVPPSPNSGPSMALWCVAKPSVPDPIIEEAMNYACGSGADCDSLQPNQPCFQPNTLFAHASYAFNSYWQRTKAAGGTCEFGGTAILVTVDPSYDGCHFVYY